MTATKVGYRGGYEQKEREGEMRDKKPTIQECVSLLDELRDYAKVQITTGHKSDKKKRKTRLSRFTEIKQILSEMRRPNDAKKSIF